MKKLLSILAVSGIITTSASTAVACEESDSNTYKNLSADDIKLYIGHNIYDSIRESLSEQAGENVTASMIKADDKITIKCYIGEATGTPLPDPTIAISGTLYNLNIIIADGDLYFNSNELVQEYPSNPGVIGDVSLDKIVIHIGHELYEDVRKSLASQPTPSTTANKIDDDDKIDIRVKSKGNTVSYPQGVIATPATYTVDILVLAGDIYFNPTNEIISIDKTAI